jgi:hypothetical protein
VKAHKLKVDIPEDHQVEIRLPEDFPSGPAEVIVLTSATGGKESGEARPEMLQSLQKLLALQLTPDEEKILDGFEEFRQHHPIDFSSLNAEER